MGFCLLLLCLGTYGQTKSKTPAKKQDDSTGVAVMNGAGRVAGIVVGSAAKAAWGTTKFVAKDVAVPVASGLLKPIATKMAPAAAKFALKKSVKYLMPLAVKLSIL